MPTAAEPVAAGFAGAHLTSRARVGAIAAAGLLGGVTNPVLERLAALAARTLGVPAALFVLVDPRRQHLCGLTSVGSAGTAATSLSQGFCPHLVASGAPLIIENTRSHPVFASHPAVEELGVAAYLGVPLVTGNGEAVGAFCAIDAEPRSWTAADRETLQDLALAAGAEIGLRELEARFRLAVEATQEVVYTFDYATGQVGREGAVEAIYGCAAGELISTSDGWLARIDPEDRARVTESWETAVRRGSGRWACEYRMRHADGAVVVVQDRARILCDPHGVPERIAGAITDVTEQRIAEEALQASEAQWRRLLESAYEGICTVDATGMITYANPRLAEMLGYARHELSGESFFSLMAADSAFDARTRFARRQLGIAEVTEISIQRKDGSTLWITKSASSLFGLDGTFTGALFFLTDISERREAEAERQRADHALRTSEERYALAARATRHAIWEWDLVPNTMRWSDGSMALFGYEPDAAGGGAAWWYQAIHPDDRDRVVGTLHRVLAGAGVGQEWRGDYRIRRGDGSYAAVIDRGYVVRDELGHAIRMIGAVEDVTRQRQLEEQLRQAQKMEAVGQLAGGVAHDFNNLLTVISGNLEFAQTDLPAALAEEHPLRADLDEIRQAAEHARTLVRQLMAFSRKQPVQLQLLRIGDVIGNAEKLLRRLIGEEITLRVHLDDSPMLVRADAGQLEQLLMNLAVNARDAMLTPIHGHPGAGGTLTIDAAAVTLSAADAGVWDGLEPGAFVYLRVRDSGHGMDAATLARAFEPFFTTKGVGAGTGLGLATVFGIVRQIGGGIRVESAPGEGTTFTILLPAADPEDETLAPSSVASLTPAPVHTTILLVEDEAPVRATLARMLARRGYAVLEARNGTEALRIWRAQALVIDAVVTDLRMPELGGRELVALLRADAPTLPVVYVSGYSEQGSATPAGAGEAYIDKPFTVDALLTAVGQVLDGARDGTGRPAPVPDDPHGGDAGTRA